MNDTVSYNYVMNDSMVADLMSQIGVLTSVHEESDGSLKTLMAEGWQGATSDAHGDVQTRLNTNFMEFNHALTNAMKVVQQAVASGSTMQSADQQGAATF